METPKKALLDSETVRTPGLFGLSRLVLEIAWPERISAPEPEQIHLTFALTSSQAGRVEAAIALARTITTIDSTSENGRSAALDTVCDLFLQSV